MLYYPEKVYLIFCCIGTQCIWLAGKWYDITASDLSPKAIERARKEA